MKSVVLQESKFKHKKEAAPALNRGRKSIYLEDFEQKYLSACEFLL